MVIKMTNNISIPTEGVDIYLIMDYSFAECKNFSIVYFGKKLNYKYSDFEKGMDICNTYQSTLKKILSSLNLKDNLLSVTIWGGEPFVMANLTNDRKQLKSCINFDDFAFKGCSNGRIYVAGGDSFLDYDPYEEIYQSAIENRKVYPKRKAVGIVITQRNVPTYEHKEKENLFKAVEKCAYDGIEIITIGLKAVDTEYKNPINEYEIKKLSTNKELSRVCNYNEMKEHLAKIAEKIGGPIDYHYETIDIEKWDNQNSVIESDTISHVQENEGVSSISMKIGIISLIGIFMNSTVGFLLAIVGLILGIYGRKCGKNPKAIVGIVLSLITIILIVMWYLRSYLMKVGIIINIIVMASVIAIVVLIIWYYLEQKN